MRKHAFRPSLSTALESRLVLSTSGSFTPLSIYKAELPGNVQSALGTMQGNLYTAFGGGPSSGFTLNGAAPTQYAMLQTNLIAGINNASTQITDLVSPLNKSKNVVSLIQGELNGLATQVNGLLTQLNATRTTTNNVPSAVSSSAASLAQTTISDMYSSVSLAIGNQIQLFTYAIGVSTKPGKAFLASKQAAASSALTPSFSALTSSIQKAYTTFTDPSPLTPDATTTFNNAIYAAIGAFNTTAAPALASGVTNGRVRTSLVTQGSGLDNGSVNQTIVGWTSSLETSYPTGFFNAALTALNSSLQADLAATASA